ncbi:hypothetical protein CRENBAI_007589 [Crenichthys baileyi]|uniref:Uncharacterized protein n=1 Tax=Crenichthys baileyi TaxID=28760 RepID=A0AAV9SG86_9TELE
MISRGSRGVPRTEPAFFSFFKSLVSMLFKHVRMHGSALEENIGQQLDVLRSVFAMSGKGFVLAGRKILHYRNHKKTNLLCLVLEDRLVSKSLCFVQQSLINYVGNIVGKKLYTSVSHRTN